MATNMEKTAFEARITNNEFDDLCNIAGLYQKSETAEDCYAGQLCVTDKLAPCEGFAGVNNENTYIMKDAAATDNIDSVVYACNTYESPYVANTGKMYHVGREVLGLGVPKDRYGNFTKINFDGQSVYRFGVGNTQDEGAGDYYTIEDGFLKNETSAPATAGAIYFRKVGSGKFIEGTSEAFGYVDLKACKVSVAAPVI